MKFSRLDSLWQKSVISSLMKIRSAVLNFVHACVQDLSDCHRHSEKIQNAAEHRPISSFFAVRQDKIKKMQLILFITALQVKMFTL
jgi:DNA-binding PucR family transcriptional regulator